MQVIPHIGAAGKICSIHNRRGITTALMEQKDPPSCRRGGTKQYRPFPTQRCYVLASYRPGVFLFRSMREFRSPFPRTIVGSIVMENNTRRIYRSKQSQKAEGTRSSKYDDVFDGGWLRCPFSFSASMMRGTESGSRSLTFFRPIRYGPYGCAGWGYLLSSMWKCCWVVN